MALHRGFALGITALIGCLAPGEQFGAEGSAPSDVAFVEGSAASEVPFGSKGLAIGWNGKSDQFPAVARFQMAEGKKAVGPKLCHNYIDWNVGEAEPGGDPTLIGSRAYWEDWLQKANSTCDETLVSFKGRPGEPPASASYRSAMAAFFKTDWKALTGYKGTFSYAAWNEPNNPARDGNGLGVRIEPDLAARYHMILEAQCKLHGGCIVAAGDFASNGQMDDDYNPSSDSYLSKYKATIAAEAPIYGLAKDYAPRAFAFHGWHDINRYLDAGAHCNDDMDCLTKRIVKSMSGAWAAVELWDTEVGAGQFRELSDDEQACGAAYLMRMTSNITPRITRLYYTHAQGGVGRLYDGDKPRPAAGILANHEQSAGARTCR